MPLPCREISRNRSRFPIGFGRRLSEGLLREPIIRAMLQSPWPGSVSMAKLRSSLVANKKGAGPEVLGSMKSHVPRTAKPT